MNDFEGNKMYDSNPQMCRPEYLEYCFRKLDWLMSRVRKALSLPTEVLCQDNCQAALSDIFTESYELCGVLLCSSLEGFYAFPNAEDQREELKKTYTKEITGKYHNLLKNVSNGDLSQYGAALCEIRKQFRADLAPYGGGEIPEYAAVYNLGQVLLSAKS